MEILNANHHLPHDALVLPVELATKEPSVPAATVTQGATVTNGAVTETDATDSDTCNSRTTGDEGLTTDTEPDNATVPNKPATEHSGLTTDTEPVRKTSTSSNRRAGSQRQTIKLSFIKSGESLTNLTTACALDQNALVLSRE